MADENLNHRFDRIEAALAGLATKADLTLAVRDLKIWTGSIAVVAVGILGVLLARLGH